MLVVDAIGDHIVEADTSIGLVMALHVESNKIVGENQNLGMCMHV